MILTKSIPVGMVVCRWKCNPVRHFHQSIVQIRHILLADKKIRARFGKPVFLSILLKKRLGHNLEIQYFESIKTLPWLTFIFWGRHPYSQYIGISQNVETQKRWNCRQKYTFTPDNHLYFDPQNNKKISKFKVHKYIEATNWRNFLNAKVGKTFLETFVTLKRIHFHYMY